MNTEPLGGEVRTTRVPMAGWVFLFSAAWVVICIPCILIAESHRVPQWPFHTSQLFMSVVCEITALKTWFHHRSEIPLWLRRLVLAGIILAGLWVAIVVGAIVLMTAFPIED